MQSLVRNPGQDKSWWSCGTEDLPSVDQALDSPGPSLDFLVRTSARGLGGFLAESG